MKFGGRQTLFDQFNKIRTLTVYSHVNIYGDVEIGQSRLKEFLAYKQEKRVPELRMETEAPGNASEGHMEGGRYNAIHEYLRGNKGKNSSQIISEENSQPLKIMNEIDILPAFMSMENDTDKDSNIMTVSEF